MFVLKKRKIGGYAFGQETFYSAHHLGTDYSAKSGTELYAPFNGKITNVLTGLQGGKTVWFRPDGRDVVIRFMHLSAFSCNKFDKVKEGKIIGWTGNTGSATKAPHLHLDISKHFVNINDFSNFIDPEKYNWNDTISGQNNTNVDKPKNEGVDISHYQGKIDWSKVKTDFVIAKATQGTSYLDPTYKTNKENWKGFFGAYHFADGGNVIKEAEHFIKNAGDCDMYVLDWEIEHPSPVAWCSDFIKIIEQSTGKDCWLYTNDARALKYDWPKNWKLWIARYKDYTGQLDWNYQPKSNWSIWQYTSRGKLEGITGNVDLNVSKVPLIKEPKLEPASPPIAPPLTLTPIPPENPSEHAGDVPDEIVAPPAKPQIPYDARETHEPSLFENLINFLINKFNIWKKH